MTSSSVYDEDFHALRFFAFGEELDLEKSLIEALEKTPRDDVYEAEIRAMKGALRLIDETKIRGTYEAEVIRVQAQFRDERLTQAEVLSTISPGYPFGPMLRFLLLTGQGWNEVAGMRWDEIENGVWTIPSEHAKNDDPQPVPLSAQARAILDALPKFDSPFVFTTNGRTSVREYLDETGRHWDNFMCGLNHPDQEKSARFKAAFDQMKSMSFQEGAPLLAIFERAKPKEGRPAVTPPWRIVAGLLEMMRLHCAGDMTKVAEAVQVALATEGKAPGTGASRQKYLARLFRDRCALRE